MAQGTIYTALSEIILLSKMKSISKKINEGDTASTTSPNFINTNINNKTVVPFNTYKEEECREENM